MRDILPRLKQMEAIKEVEGLKGKLTAIDAELSGGRSNWHALDERLRRWRESARVVIKAHLRPEELEALERAYRKASSSRGIDTESPHAYLDALLETLHAEPALALPQDRDSDVTQSGPGAVAERLIPQTRRVLIIHGHDEGNLQALAGLLRERYHLEPVILRREPGKGRTLIEKFEQEATTCSFAFVLMTPDDQVVVGGGQYAQARPNALFELGWEYGRMGRSRVCILFKKGTKIHSDLDGIERIEFIDSVEEAVLKIERELQAAELVAVK